MDVLHDVGERLTRLRLAAGLEVEPAAALARIDAERLDQAESGAIALTDEEIRELANAYGIDATEIFGARITPVRDYAGGA